MEHMHLNIDLIGYNQLLENMLSCLLTRYPTPHSSTFRTSLNLLFIFMFMHACCCSIAQKQPLASINTGTKLLLNSAVSAVTEYLFTNPLTSDGYWVYLGMSVLEVNPGNNMVYKAYVYDLTTVSYRICLNVGRTGSTSVYYKVEVRYFEYHHSSLYWFGNCMVDLKFFNVTTSGLSIISGSRKIIRSSLAQSAYMSRINKIKCIPHLTGISISTQYDVSLAADCDASFVYLDISSSGQSLVDWVIVYVLCIDLFIARLHMGLNVEYGPFSISNGNVLTYPLIMPNMVDATTTSHLYGITSLNIQANLRVALSLSQPLLNLLSIPSFEYNYLYLNKLSCTPNTHHLNLATQSCNLFYDGFEEECGQISMGSVRKVVGDSSSGATKILRIGQWKGTKIVAVATSTRVYLYIGDSNQVLVRLQHFSYNSSITDIRFSEQPLILVVASQNKLMTYKFGDHANRFSPYVTISIPLNALSVLISPNALKLSAVYPDANNSHHLITYSHNIPAANFILVQDFHLPLSSTSQIDMVWDHNATRLLIFNSFSHVMLQDTSNNGQFSSAVTPPSIYKLIDDGLPIYAALSTDAQVLVVSVGRWKYSSGSNSYQGSLHIYRYDIMSNGYRQQQVLNNDKFYSSINGGQQVSMSAQGLILIVQALSSSKKYQLIYSRDSIQQNFVLKDVINEGLSTSVSETGLAISSDGQLLVTPYDGNNILAYYCKDLYVAQQYEQPESAVDDCCSQDITMPKQGFGLIVSGSIMGSVLFCCLFVFLIHRNKEKKKIQCKIIAQFKNRQTSYVNKLTVSAQLIANATQDQIYQIMNGVAIQGEMHTKSLQIANELVDQIGGRENAIPEYYGQTLESQEIINGNVGDSMLDARNQVSQCVEQQLKKVGIWSKPDSLLTNQLAQQGLESQIEQKLSQQQQWVQQKTQEQVQSSGEQKKKGVRQGKGGEKQRKRKRYKKVMIIYEQVGEGKEDGEQEEIEHGIKQETSIKKQ